MINGGYCFGKIKINLKNEVKFFDKLAFNRLYNKTGIQRIYRSSKEQTSLSLGIEAAKKILKNIKENIDGLIFVTQSPINTIPSCGSTIHRELKLKNNCFVLDIIQGCSGFPYALSIACNMIKNNEINNCLIITSETYTKYIDNKNRNCLPIFSDASSAIFLNKKNTPKLLSSYYLTDGKGEKNLTNSDLMYVLHGIL